MLDVLNAKGFIILKPTYEERENWREQNTENTYFNRGYRNQTVLLDRVVLRIELMVLGVLIAIALGSTIFSGLKNIGQFNSQWQSDFMQNFATEMFGAILTFILLEKVVGAANRVRERTKNEMSKLTERVKYGPGKIDAVNTLRDRGWLRILADIKLEDTNLTELNFQNTYLDRANFARANLSRANFSGTSLHKADLLGANLTKSSFIDANLSNTDLSWANFNGADLSGANLRGARLFEVKNILEARFSRTTILPNGEKWQLETNLEIFTNPKHPLFYDPNKPIQDRE